MPKNKKLTYKVSFTQDNEEAFREIQDFFECDASEALRRSLRLMSVFVQAHEEGIKFFLAKEGKEFQQFDIFKQTEDGEDETPPLLS